MALGGGTFLVQNKVLPGAYINFISLAVASATLSDRGIATMPLELDWGITGNVFEVTNEDFQKNSLKIFGYEYTHGKLKGLRDLFRNIKTLYAYRLNGGGEKATNTYATAKYAGIRGNDLKIVIKANVDVPSSFDVQTVLGVEVMDVQTVTTASKLVDNDWVVFKKEASLELTAGLPLTGGTNTKVTGTQHQAYLNKIEAFAFNTMGVVVTDGVTKSLYQNFCKRLRDEVGAKFQVVLHQQAADYMGAVNVKNVVTDEGWSEASLVYWVTGITAGCDVNKSNLNKKYDGEFTVNVDFTQKQLENAIKNGEFTLHQVGDKVRVLEDINSMVTTTDTCGDVFKDNQTVRVIDQIANDIAVLFNTKYLGVVPNDKAGRTSLWADIVKHHQLLQDIRAIEDFKDEHIKVSQGDTKKAVVVDDVITVVNAMAKLYMTVTVC
ncbi:MAG: phage tail sheath family protein [Peptostreptococcaceae bacterium]|nr:phage tail sheath family protein [Peptostreptococcaceae bacterium]